MAKSSKKKKGESVKSPKVKTKAPKLEVPSEPIKTDALIAEIDKEDQVTGLNPRQERFAQLYATDKEFFGNGVQSYIEVYDPDTSKPNWYKTACATASEILTNPKVCRRINELLEADGLNDNFVDKQLLFVITQHYDTKSKVAAIKEYNKLKSRVEDKTQVSVNFSLSDLLKQAKGGNK